MCKNTRKVDPVVLQSYYLKCKNLGESRTSLLPGLPIHGNVISTGYTLARDLALAVHRHSSISHHLGAGVLSAPQGLQSPLCLPTPPPFLSALAGVYFVTNFHHQCFFHLSTSLCESQSRKPILAIATIYTRSPREWRRGPYFAAEYSRQIDA